MTETFISKIIRSGADFKEIDEHIATLTLYLSQQSKGEQLTPEVRSSLKELKTLVAAA